MTTSLGKQINPTRNGVSVNFIYLLASLIIFVATYPPTYSFLDEAGYLGMAYTVRNMTIHPDVAGLKVVMTFPEGDHYVSKHSIGWPLLLSPFAVGKGEYVFWGGYVYFILGFVIYLLLLKRSNLSLNWGFLYLFYPPFVLYSRTIMADLPAAVFILAGFYLYTRNEEISHFLSGLAFGISAFLRHPNILIFFVFVILAVKDYKKSLYLIAGAIPAGLMIAAYNQAAYSHWFAGNMRYMGYFTLKTFPKFLFLYLLTLFALYPLMPLGAWMRDFKYKREIIVSSLVLVLFYSAWYFFQERESLFETLVMGQRFILPVSALLLLPYAGFLERIAFRNAVRKKVLQYAVPLVLILGSLLISFKQGDYAKRQRNLTSFLAQNTPQDALLVLIGKTSKLVQPFWVNFDYSFSLPEKLPRKDCYVAVFMPAPACFAEVTEQYDITEASRRDNLVLFRIQQPVQNRGSLP